MSNICLPFKVMTMINCRVFVDTVKERYNMQKTARLLKQFGRSQAQGQRWMKKTSCLETCRSPVGTRLLSHQQGKSLRPSFFLLKVWATEAHTCVSSVVKIIRSDEINRFMKFEFPSLPQPQKLLIESFQNQNLGISCQHIF